MKKYHFLFILILIAINLFSQEKVVKHDGDGQKWINTLESGYIITSGRAESLELAQQQAIHNVKQSIVQSVAEHIKVNTSNKTTELNGDVNLFLNTYSADVKTESGNVPFLKGISLSKVEGWYWEKIKNTKTKAIFYRYYIRYPFSDSELNALIAAYQKNDRELTERLNTVFNIINNTTSLDEMLAANNNLREMNGIFKDQRKQQVRTGLAVFQSTIKSLAVVAVENNPGKMEVVLVSGTREFTVAKLPRVNSPCASVEEISSNEGTILITYNYDYCKVGSDQNYLEFYFSIGSVRIKDVVHFNVTAYKVEMSIKGKVQMELINNLAKLDISLKTTYNTAFTITRIELELPNDKLLIFEPLELFVDSKGTHQLKAGKSLSSKDLNYINNASFKSISGRIFYIQGNTQITSSYRFYKVDIIFDK
jgi:hypothetical protein